jgi:hypothetical protein
MGSLKALYYSGFFFVMATGIFTSIVILGVLTFPLHVVLALRKRLKNG